MVGIRAGIGDNLYCLFEFDPLLCQQADQFRNYHTWMGVIDLNRRIICQIVKLASPGHTLLQDQLCSCRNHQILLVNTQSPPSLV